MAGTSAFRSQLLAALGSAAFDCMLLLHSPDGSPIWIRAASINAMKQAPKADHVAAGTRTIVFTPAKTFGLAETGEEIAAEIRLCKM